MRYNLYSNFLHYIHPYILINPNKYNIIYKHNLIMILQTLKNHYITNYIQIYYIHHHI